jgi:prolyl-tRNA synthetase
MIDASIEVLFDDRANITPGFKFKDADLLGMPLQVIVGDKSLKSGQIEIKRRRTGERIMIKREGAVTEIQKMLAE